MDKDLLPNRDILKRIVVEVDETAGKKETRRVTDGTQHNIHLVRRQGEGSRPLFDRDEIINGRRIFEGMGQDGRFADRSHCTNSDFGGRLRTDRDSYPSNYHGYIGGRMSCERSRDDLFFRSRRGLCPMCYSNSDYFAESGDNCAEGRQRRVYRTLSEERLTRRHSAGYHNYIPAEMETFYLYEDPQYYAVWESSLPRPLYNYTYYSH